eukprot:10943073-Prorocentrum_lima.AAC.1
MQPWYNHWPMMRPPSFTKTLGGVCLNTSHTKPFPQTSHATPLTTPTGPTATCTLANSTFHHVDHPNLGTPANDDGL